MRVIVILDIRPQEGEPRRESGVVIEELESEIERVAVDVPNASGTHSAHEIKVLACGTTWPAVQENLTVRQQFNSARD